MELGFNKIGFLCEFLKICTLTALLCKSGVTAKTCTKQSACSCQTDSGNIIDLSPLSRSDGTPAYTGIEDPGGPGDSYDWNPCSAFSISSCTNVAACHEVISGPVSQYISLGTQDTADFAYDGDQLTLVYKDSTLKQQAKINLVCEDCTEGVFTALGQDIPPTGVYSFQLKSKYACEKIKSCGESGESGLSVGSYICIVFASVLFVYVVLGVLIQMFIRKESGARAIPNHDFWVSCPGNVKAGIVFVVSRGKSSSYGKI